MHHKNSRPPPFLLEEANQRKGLNLDPEDLSTFGKYASLSSPLFTPQTDFATPVQFMKRIFRMIQCNLLYIFPDISEIEAIKQLQEVEEKYLKDEEFKENEANKDDFVIDKERRLIRGELKIEKSE